MLKRKIYDKILEWKNTSNGKSALLIEGARRIGKSTVVEEFAKKEYDSYIILDFAKENENIKKEFEINIDNLDLLFQHLCLEKKKVLYERKSCIIFDEVQLCPKARQAIKYLVKDGRYDYIETGSLISIHKNVKDILIPSEERKIQMYPMDFEEFLWANGDEVSYDYVRECFTKKESLWENKHEDMMRMFREYMAVGGMPEAVQMFCDGLTYEEIDMKKQEILSLYKEDLKKNDLEFGCNSCVIFKTVPEQLQNHNSHFKMSLIDKNARYNRYMDSFPFITESMICNECLNVTKPDVALDLYAEQSNFKLYMNDTGLLITQIYNINRDEEDTIYKKIIFNRLNTNEGMIYENVVAQMLKTRGYDLRFHEFKNATKENEKGSTYEVDFVIVKNGKICPIEVKSAKEERHKSFDLFKEKYNLKTPDKYIICKKNFKIKDNITYLPIYMTLCL